MALEPNSVTWTACATGFASNSVPKIDWLLPGSLSRYGFKRERTLPSGPGAALHLRVQPHRPACITAITVLLLLLLSLKLPLLQPAIVD